MSDENEDCKIILKQDPGYSPTRTSILPFEVKADDRSGKRMIQGYASIANVIDWYLDIMMNGAFKNGDLEERFKKNLIKTLYNHDRNKPLGNLIHVEEDSTGLYFESQVLQKVSWCEDFWELASNGVVDRVSFGYDLLGWSEIESPELRQQVIKMNPRFASWPIYAISLVRLREISPVTMPANEETSFVSFGDGKEQKLFSEDESRAKAFALMGEKAFNSVKSQGADSKPQSAQPGSDEVEEVSSLIKLIQWS
jgi:HK97 family phage prohead protease